MRPNQFSGVHHATSFALEDEGKPARKTETRLQYQNTSEAVSGLGIDANN